MKITLVVSSGEPEVIWNAFRLANLMLNKLDDVVIFLHGPAVEYARVHSDRFPLRELAKVFVLNEGVLRA